MKFCPKCETKLPRKLEELSLSVICPICNTNITNYDLELKMKGEWNELLEIYLIKLCGRKIETFEEKIKFYSLDYVEKVLLDLGYNQELVRNTINSYCKLDFWLNEFLSKSINPEEFKNNNSRYDIFIILVNKLKTELIKIKLQNKNKSNSFSTFIQWTKCKTEGRILYSELKKIKEKLYHYNYEILLIKSNNIIVQHIKIKNIIFLYVNTSLEPHEFGIDYFTLSKFLINLESQRKKKNKNNDIIEEEIGALTKYGWHANLSTKYRQKALREKCLVDGFEMAIGTLQHMGFYWRNRHDGNYEWYLQNVEEDIDWIRGNYPKYTKKVKDFLSSQYMELQKENEQLKNTEADSMLILNTK